MLMSLKDKEEPENTYASLLQPANDLYQEFSSMQPQYDGKTDSATNPNAGEREGRDAEHGYDVYENF